MDFLGYAALGGFERIAIVGGAILIGYWGYRIYSRDKTPGLIFLGLACAMLVSALLTGGGHVRSVSEGMQLASIPEAAVPGVESATAVTTAAATAQDAADTPWANGQSVSAAADATEPNPAADTLVETDSAEPSVDVLEEAAAELDVTAAAEPAADSLPLATGQELGGRIVSIKSAQVSLEWSERE